MGIRASFEVHGANFVDLHAEVRQIGDSLYGAGLWRLEDLVIAPHMLQGGSPIPVMWEATATIAPQITVVPAGARPVSA